MRWGIFRCGRWTIELAVAASIGCRPMRCAIGGATRRCCRLHRSWRLLDRRRPPHPHPVTSSNTPSDGTLSAVLRKVSDNIVLIGPARNRSQTGAAFASFCSIVLLCLLCATFIIGTDDGPNEWASFLPSFGFAMFLVVMVCTQLFYPRSFLFQRAPTYAVFDREARRGYWASDGQLRAVPWKEVRFYTVETSRESSAGQRLHQHFLRIESAGPSKGRSVEIPVAQTLDRSSGAMVVSKLVNASRRFMRNRRAMGTDTEDLRQQPQGSILRSIGTWVIPSHQSLKTHPWSVLFGVLGFPWVSLFFIFTAFYMAAVKATSTPVRWPDELLSRIGEVPAGSQLEAVISSKT